MKKLYEIFGKNHVAGDVGLEIECEGKGFKEVFSEYWSCEDDGSLRGRFPATRIEYVLNKPIPVEEVKKAVIELKENIPGAVPDFSFRTSVHAHVNVLDMTSHQILSFIYTYLLLEEPLMNFCGKERKGNRFCLRYQDADGMTKLLESLFTKGVENLELWDEIHIRYAAMNLAAIKKYGSIEFRGMRGTLDEELLNIWTMALVSIRNYACHQKDCLDVHDTFNKLGAEEFLQHVLGDLSQYFTYKGVEKDVGLNFSLSINLPHLFHENFVKEKPKKEKSVKEEMAPWQNVPGEPFDFEAAPNRINAGAPARPARALRVRNIPEAAAAQRRADMLIMDDIAPEEENHEF